MLVAFCNHYLRRKFWIIIRFTATMVPLFVQTHAQALLEMRFRQRRGRGSLGFMLVVGRFAKKSAMNSLRKIKMTDWSKVLRKKQWYLLRSFEKIHNVRIASQMNGLNVQKHDVPHAYASTLSSTMWRAKTSLSVTVACVLSFLFATNLTDHLIMRLK